MTTEAEVLDALSRVRDPELDQPITELRFVAGVAVEGERVSVRLRLPTYFCAPNFAFLMVSDAKSALLELPGVRTARVELEDHFASEEINAGVGGDQSFQSTFEGQAEDELGELRDIFLRKGFLMRQEKLCRGLLESGSTLEELASLRLGDVGDRAETRAYLERRAELGLDVSETAPLVINADGSEVDRDVMADHLRFARTIGVSIEGNAGVCRGLLATRYGVPDPEEVTA